MADTRDPRSGGRRPRSGGRHPAKPPAKPLTARSFQLVSSQLVGGYALQLVWADGHGDGLYTFERLRTWGDSPPELPPLPA